jgi:hypothetical protein
MKWATRRGAKVDRAACAWLIRRHIDPDAEFLFVADPADVPADATPFEFAGAELGHHDGACTFEVMVRKFGLADAIPARLAEIVHEADIGDERFAAPEAPGLDAIVRGIALLGDDIQTLELTAPIFDALVRMARHSEDGGANTQT